jgi:hypothetical protein
MPVLEYFKYLWNKGLPATRDALCQKQKNVLETVYLSRLVKDGVKSLLGEEAYD